MMDSKIQTLNQRLQDWRQRFTSWCQASSLGAEDMVITDALYRLGLDISIFTLDTGRLYPATYRLIDRVHAHYGYRLTVYYPQAEALEQLVRQQGMNGFYESMEKRQACCQVRKVDVLARALAGQQAWVTGLRREQSVGRQQVALEEQETHSGVTKLNPLVDWTRDEVWAYIQQYSVPYNPLHDQGYASVGCEPCTRALQPGEEERAGRWWWEVVGKKECGLHGGSPQESNSTTEKVES